MNTFWLIVAGLILLFAAAFLFVFIPWMRKRQNKSPSARQGLANLLTARLTPAIAGSAAIILIAVCLYLAWSKPATTTPAQDQIAQNGQMAPEHIEMINSLKTRLEQNPNDGKGWAMLGRSYAVLGRFAESAAAYEKATNLIPKQRRANGRLR